MDRKQLVVCAICQDQAAYLPEWLAYHRLVGVDHFVLYDNASTDDPARAVRNSPLAGQVTLVHWPQRPGQLAAYRHFIDIFAPGFEWVAFLDVDDFLVPLNSRNVVDTLDWLGSAAGVLVHRRVFGPGTWQEPPPGLVIENYDRRAPDDFPANRQVRTIARCSHLLDVTANPHEFSIDGPVFNTAGHLAPNSAVQAQPCYQNLVINHYHTRSRADWLAKVERNNASADPAMPREDPALFDHLAAVCQVRDATIQAFAMSVKGLLGIDQAASPSPQAAGPDAAMQRSPAAQMSPALAESPTMAAAVPPASASASMPLPMAPPPATPAPPLVADAVATAMTEALTQHAARSSRVRAGQSPPAAAAASAAPAWVRRGPDAQERTGGLGLVFRDRSRPGEHWLAALRGSAVAAIDPAFLLDENERIRDFATDAEARDACDAALAQLPRH